jgi:hypothetical protein
MLTTLVADLGVESLQRVRAVDLDSVRPRKGREGQYVVLRRVHARGELEHLVPELAGHRAPLRLRCIGRLLHERPYAINEPRPCHRGDGWVGAAQAAAKSMRQGSSRAQSSTVLALGNAMKKARK